MQVATGEDGAGWLAFLRGLTARGLTGVKRVTSDAHRGLVSVAMKKSPLVARLRSPLVAM